MRHSHGHRGHYGKFKGDGGPGRVFESGDLRFVILHLISEGPKHGYEIIKVIENRMGGSHSPSPGIVYPTLTLLEEMGFADVTPEGARKRYVITESGRQELQTHRAVADAVLQRMQQAGERQARDRSGPLVRAMENLKLVLRMGSEQWSPERLVEVTDMIDEVAKRIERL